MFMFSNCRAAMRISMGGILAGLLAAAVMAQSIPAMSEVADVQTVSKSQLEAAAKRRVVFGHQSVGYNILEGVRTLAAEQGVALNIDEMREPPASGAGIFHFTAGSNGDPLGKAADFAKTVGAASYPKTDVALVKLCYVDFDQSSDAVAIAKTYTDTIKKLQAARPETRFVAVTAPLTAIPGGAKAWVKKMIGRTSPDLANNAKRKEFNDYLRKQFDAAHLFDIARLEAETAVGADGKDIEALRGDLTDDGGHLNAKGQRIVGAAFLKMISGDGTAN